MESKYIAIFSFGLLAACESSVSHPSKETVQWHLDRNEKLFSAMSNLAGYKSLRVVTKDLELTKVGDSIYKVYYCYDVPKEPYRSSCDNYLTLVFNTDINKWDLIGHSIEPISFEDNQPFTSTQKINPKVAAPALSRSIIGNWTLDFTCIDEDLRRDYPEEFSLQIASDSLVFRAGLIGYVNEAKAKLEKLPTRDRYLLSANGQEKEHTFSLSDDGLRLYTDLQAVDKKGCHLVRK